MTASLRGQLLKVYWAMERRIVPGLEYSQHRYEARLMHWIRTGVRWLDLGCGRRLLPPWREPSEHVLMKRASHFVGIDLDLGSLLDNRTVHDRVFGPAQHLPFTTGSFDVVTANMVVEHLEDPVGSFREVSRVLAPGGLFLFHTPNADAFPTVVARRIPGGLKTGLARLLDGRQGKDVFNTFYRANTVRDVESVARLAGLHVAEMNLVSTTAIFSVLPPLALAELLYLRSLRGDNRKERRSNMIAVLSKGEHTAGVST